MSDLGLAFRIWLIGMSCICFPFLIVLLLYIFLAPHYKGKARAKVTDSFRHDTDSHGREAPTGFGENVSYSAHYVFEVDGVKYRGYGNIGLLAKLTRRVSVRYDPQDPSRNGIATSPLLIIIPIILIAGWTALVIFVKRAVS